MNLTAAIQRTRLYAIGLIPFLPTDHLKRIAETAADLLNLSREFHNSFIDVHNAAVIALGTRGISNVPPPPESIN